MHHISKSRQRNLLLEITIHSALGIPLFYGAEAGYTFGLDVRNDIAVIQLLNEAWEAVYAVRINTGLGGASKHFCTGISSFTINAARTSLLWR